MASVLLTLMIFFLIQHVRPLSAQKQGDQACPSSFLCGSLGTLGYPFTTAFKPNCGLCVINCTEAQQTIRLGRKGPWYDIQSSFANNKSLFLSDNTLYHALNSHNCHLFNEKFSLPKSSAVSFTTLYNETLWKCPKNVIIPPESRNSSLCRILRCADDIYHCNDSQITLPGCSLIQYPRFLVVEVSNKCLQCMSEGGYCQDLNNGEKFKCVNNIKGRRKLRLLLGLGTLGGSFLLMLFGLIFCHLKRIKLGLPSISSSNISADRTRTDLGRSKMYFSVPVFSYNDLEEATNNFDPSMELGDGGFGTVYYGKLKDGREVAVKRLYERNYRQLEQFMNEIEILACLRHQNLVSLYGCTSRRSRELLLVFEYVPNGTVADHLYSDQDKYAILTWSARMSIAIDTARALAYLHASDIIHRDVKSNNILLDNNFGVKVADFGLSRLFPMDVTHISTIPQGTPGYLDPEYHQCYQLTDKSDVYSFGVVLIELISSMPAIDIDRIEEVNLSCYAMKRIQCSAFQELVDPRLGFESNDKIKRMIMSVAELAFQCLQYKKEFRPSMAEVLESLRNINNEECEVLNVE